MTPKTMWLVDNEEFCFTVMARDKHAAIRDFACNCGLEAPKSDRTWKAREIIRIGRHDTDNTWVIAFMDGTHLVLTDTVLGVKLERSK